jgi:hypothetical protein
MTRTKSEELALLVLRLAKAVDTDLNVAPDSRLAADCKEARELAIQVLGDHVVQDVVRARDTCKRVVTCFSCWHATGEPCEE